MADVHVVTFSGGIADLPNTVEDTDYNRRAHVQFALLVATLLLMLVVASRRVSKTLAGQRRAGGSQFRHTTHNLTVNR